MQKLSYVIIVVLAVACIALMHGKSAGYCAGPAQSGTVTSTPSIEVNATEFKKFQADEFLVHASISMSNVDKESLFKQMESRRQRILAIVKELEIPEKDVQQNSIELRKEWSYKDGSRKFAQYDANQGFVITVGDKQNAANLVEALSLESDVDVGRTAATLKNVEKLQKSIVDAAGKKAMDKAEMYASSVGAKLGRILNIGAGYNDGIVNDGAGVMMLRNGPMMKSAGLNHSADMSTIADSVTLSAEIRLVVEIK